MPSVTFQVTVEAETEMYAQMLRLSGQPRHGTAKGQHNPVATPSTVKKLTDLTTIQNMLHVFHL